MLPAQNGRVALVCLFAGTPTATPSTNAAACADVNSELLGLHIAEEHPSRDNATSCAKLAALHACDHPAHGPKIRVACPVSCGVSGGTLLPLQTRSN